MRFFDFFLGNRESRFRDYNGYRLRDLFNEAMQTDSGVTVNREKTLSLDTMFAAVRDASNDVATLPIAVYERGPDGRKRVNDHPAYALLHNAPNPEMTAFTFWQVTMSHVLLCGNGYSFIQRDNNGTPVSMLVLNPETTRPFRANGVLYYEARTNTGQSTILEADNVFHIKNLSHDGLLGFNIIEMLKETIGGHLAVRKYGHLYFKQGGTPKTVIEMPGKFRDDEAVERFRDAWNKYQEGPDNAHKMAVLEGGAKYISNQLKNDEAQFIETLQVDIRQAANIIGFPPHRLGDIAKVSYSSIEAENKAYLIHYLQPRLVNIEQESNRKLLTGKQYTTGTHYVEYIRDALLQGDRKTEVEVIEKEVNAGLLTVNEARAKRNEKPFDIPEANLPRCPVNLYHLGTDERPASGGGGNDTGDRFEKVTQATFSLQRMTTERMARRLFEYARRKAVKPDEYTKGVNAIREKHESVLRAAFDSVSELACISSEKTREELSEQLTEAMLSTFEAEMIEASGCDRSELYDAVTERLGRWQDDINLTIENILSRNMKNER